MSTAALRLATLSVLASLILPACHGRYKRNADSLGKVRVKVQVPADPRVEVGSPPQADIPENAVEAAELGIDLAKVVLGTKVERKLDKAVQPGEARTALVDTFAAELDVKGLPYKVGDEGRSRMIIVVEDFGLDATNGTPTAFVSTHTEIFNRDGKKVYNSRSVCTRDLGPGLNLPFTSADDLAALQTLNGLKPGQMEAVLLKVTEQCAAEVAAKLVSHLD